ncbi:MAG: DNA topoisomerase VI subunit B [Halobacteria archaeon]
MKFQSDITESVDGDGDIADDLADEQRSISVAEFFEKNRQMLGFDSGARALVTAVKEGVDNALDACEEADVLPDIYVGIEENKDTYRVTIEDNGPGIKRKQIPKIFGKLLYGSRFGKRVQSRGQQGIGISAAVLYGQLTSGKPAKITSKTRTGEAHEFHVIIDTDTNEPEIIEDEVVEWDRIRGTRIEIEMEANMRARQQLHKYVKHTAVVNPHARIHLHEPGEKFEFERATDELPEKPSEIKPHPHGIELGTLQRMLASTDSYSLSGFVTTEFTRVGSKTADSMLNELRDRLYGREAAWTPPREYEETDLRDVVTEAVSNKTSEATETFAEKVVDGGDGFAGVGDRSRATYGMIREAVDCAAEEVETEFGTTFGSTVRANTVEAVWTAVRRSAEDDLYNDIDDATEDRKDDKALSEVAERLSGRFEETDKGRATREELEEWIWKAADSVEKVRDERFGEKSRGKILDTVWDAMFVVDDDVPNVNEIAEDRDLTRLLIEGMRETDVIAPPTDCLSPITAKLMEAGLRKEYDAEFYSTETRDAEVHGGDPFIVEAGIAYGGSLESDSKTDLLRFANRVPLVYQQGACVITEAIQDIGWKNYQLDGARGSVPKGPAVLMVHIASTNVPFTSESKDAVASVPEMRDEIERAVRIVARDLKDHINKQSRRKKKREKERVVKKLLPQMADKIAEVTGKETPEMDGTLARILNKVFVSQRKVDDGVEIKVDNYANSKKSFDLHGFVESEPELSNGEARVVDMDGEWDVVWTVELPKGETQVLEIGVDDAPVLNVDGLEDEMVDVQE